MADRPGLASELLLYRRIVGARIRSDWQYRTSFFTFLAGQALVTALDFVTVLLVLDLVPSLGGWSGPEVAFLYAVATLPFGIADLLASSVDRVSVYILQGTFDRLLLRPTSTLLQLSAIEFELRRFGKLVPPMVVLAWAMPNLDVDWTAARLAVLVLVLVCGTVIYSSLWVMTSALSFWVVGAKDAMNAATYGGQYANQYPLHLYRGWIRAVLGWIVPLAFVAYVPSIYLLGAPNPLDLPDWLVLATVPVTVVLFALALTVWSVGTRRYQGTGS